MQEVGIDHDEDRSEEDENGSSERLVTGEGEGRGTRGNHHERRYEGIL